MAMLRAVVVSVVVGLVFLIALTVAMTDIPGTTASAAPVSFIMEDQLGATVKDLFLVVVNVAIFANGLIIMMSGSRLVFAMSRDKRFPGHQLFGRVIPSTATPAWAVGLIMVGGIVFTLVFSTDALFKLFTAGSILPALIYLATVLMYLKVRPKLKLIPSTMTLGRWEPFVVTGALLWLVFELTVLLFPSQFWDSVKLVAVLIAIGAVTFVAFRIFSPHSLDDMPESELGEVEPERVHA
jgi:amino acid transporter